MAEPKRPVLATPAEIQTLFRRALVLLDEMPDLDDDDDDDDDLIREANIRTEAAREALRFCCVAAGFCGDSSLVPIVAEAIEVLDGVPGRGDGHLRAMAEGLGDLLAAGAPADADVEELARHREADVRSAVAANLRPRGERALALLEALAADPVVEVRRAARSSLAAVREVAWWQGKFRTDPAARLDPDEALRLKPAFERLSALLDQGRFGFSAPHVDELAALAGALPDALAVELVEVLHSGSDRYTTRYHALLGLMLAREGGVDAFARLCARWDDERAHVQGKDLALAIAALPEPRRAEVCLALARRAAALPERERGRYSRGGGRLLAETVGAGWPAGADLTPLLDVILAIPPMAERRIDYVASALGAALAAEGADPASILDRLIAARLAGFPGAWRSIGASADRLLARASGPALRLAAEQAALSDDAQLAAWGLLRLTDAAHDPARDGPLPEVIERLFTDARARRIMLPHHELSPRLVAPLRRALRAGALAYPEACAALRVIDALWGGVIITSHLGVRHEVSDGEDPYRVKQREAHAAFLGPAELHGPPTAEEWAALRAARAPALTRPGPGGGHDDERPGEPPLGIAVLPPGPFDAEDRAVFDAALARLRAGDADAAIPLAAALLGKGSPDDLPLFDELCERAPSELRSIVKRMRATAREALGLPRTPAEAGRDEAPDDEGDEDAQWMDEDD